MTHTTVVLLRSGRLVDLGAGERIPATDDAVDALVVPVSQVSLMRAKPTWRGGRRYDPFPNAVALWPSGLR
jgi:hypothetical protein